MDKIIVVIGFALIWVALMAVRLTIAYLFGMLAAWLTGVDQMFDVYLPNLFMIVALITGIASVSVSRK